MKVYVFVYQLAHGWYGSQTTAVVDNSGVMHIEQSGPVVRRDEETPRLTPRGESGSSVARFEMPRLTRRNAFGMTDFDSGGAGDEFQMSLLATNQSATTPSKYWSILTDPDGTSGQIGSGGYGTVYLKQTQCKPDKVAVKIQTGGQALKNLKEFDIHSMFKGNAFVAQLIDYNPKTQEELNSTNELIGLFEYANGGDLFPDEKKPDRRYLAPQVAYDAYQGLKLIHEKGILHNDIKLDNLLVSEPDNADCVDDECRILITDFGLASHTEEAARAREAAGEQVYQACPDKKEGQACVWGTLGYIAPELSDSRPTPASDLWALGVTLYQFYFQMPLFDWGEHRMKFQQLRFSFKWLAIAARELKRGWVSRLFTENWKEDLKWDFKDRVIISLYPPEYAVDPAPPELLAILDSLLDPDPATRGKGVEDLIAAWYTPDKKPGAPEIDYTCFHQGPAYSQPPAEA